MVAAVLALVPAAPAAAGVTILDGAKKSRNVEVIVQFKGGVSQSTARALVRAYHGRPGVNLPIINAVSAQMRADRAARLGRNHRVRAVTINRKVRGTGKPKATTTSTLSPFDLTKLGTLYNQTVDVPPVWAGKATGAGIGVAVIDTGIAGDLPDFAKSKTDPTSRVIASVVTNPDATTATDSYGHGTHVAGIIAGNGAYRSDSLFSKYVGVAPDANLISVKASDEQGNSTVIDVLLGLMFVIEHKDDYNIRVVNMSLASATPSSYKTDPLDLAVEVAWKMGITVVVASGNRGTDDDAVQYAPANDPYVITVGGEDTMGTPSPNDDGIASWTSRGTTQDGYAKPEIYAPGRAMVSLLAPNSAFSALCPACVVDGGYIRASGTSMAAPVVSGAVADLLQLHPDWTPDQLKGALLNTAATRADGAREIDVAAAAKAAGSKLNSNNGLTWAWNFWTFTDNGNNTYDVTNNVDGTRSSWSRSSWSSATGDLNAAWARSSWSCTCSVSTGAAVDPERSSWSRSSWSTILGTE